MIPDTGDDTFDPPFDEELFDEDFEQEGGDPDPEFGDDADNSGESGDGQHPSEAADGDGLGESTQEVRRPSRAQARIETALREAREATARAESLERQLREVSQTQTRASEAERERQLLEQMDPLERAEYRATRAEQRADQNYAAIQQRLADADDRAAFAADCVGNPALARVKDQVEAQLAQSRANGVTVPRSVLAAFLIGQQVLSKAPAARAKQGKKAAANVSRERGRPVAGGSDVQGGRVRDERAARLARLESASI